MKKILYTLALIAQIGLVTSAATSVVAEDDLAPENISGATTVDSGGVFDVFTKFDDLVIIDSRKKRDYDAGHVEGATRLIDVETDGASLAEVIPTKQTPVLFYCNGPKCGRAANSVKIAVEQGYEDIYYYYKGMNDWKDQGLPLVVE